jgi:hypothetical protein
MNEYASSALLIRLAPDSGFNFIGVKGICCVCSYSDLGYRSINFGLFAGQCRNIGNAW